jgi:hypothetical protein
MARPKADLDSLTVSKDAGDPRPAGAAPDTVAPKGYAHTLSLRLTADQYRRLRRYVADQEDKTGKRATHQAIIEAALDEYLTGRSA